MKIEIISDDRMSSGKNLSRVAWELSRSPDDATPLDTILSIDAPVNEIPSIVMSIECTILEREIFASFRDHVMWARTSRVDAPSEFEIPDYFKYSDVDVASIILKEKIKSEMDAGVIQDEYRLHMPISAKTSFTTRISWRGLVKIYKLYEYLSTIDNYFIIGKDELDNKFDLKKYAGNYSYVDPIPVLQEDEMINCKAGPIVTIFQEMTIGLRAQVVRHRNYTIKDNLMEIIKSKDCWTKTLGDKITISISAEIEFWKTVVNKRQCWIAQYGIWKNIIVAVQKHLSVSEEDLPCNKGFCPYTRDAELRHTDDDPGAPCPIHSELNSMPIDPKYMEMVRIEASYRPAFWQKHINKLERVQ
tara:strand:- start:1496 stop:2572 length:1077 start_codon:yes stop_codon:yes gene_type:complete